MRLVALLIGLLLPAVTHGMGLADIGGLAGQIWQGPCTILPYCGQGNAGVLILTGIVIRTVLWAIGGTAVVVILYGAVRIIASGGSEDATGKGKKALTYAALGLLLAMLASAIMNYILQLVGDTAGRV